MSDWYECDLSTLQNATLSRDSDLSIKVPGDFDWFEGGLVFRNVDQPRAYFDTGLAVRVMYHVLNVSSVTVWSSGSDGMIRFDKPMPPPPKKAIIDVYVDPEQRLAITSGSGNEIMSVDRRGNINCAWSRSMANRVAAIEDSAVFVERGWNIAVASDGNLNFSRDGHVLMSLDTNGTLALNGLP
ncbi:hypothetical protein GHT06_003839 [Daphnia sinensis]|uniref:Uncharacterized protein n=1 Tax=Daphnia sinensis TaxID=1820382 RepID=A0AAD5KTX3_9CRUS|nr:hypothetical protein GHT06_003839 [Daphnia sinensis]